MRCWSNIILLLIITEFSYFAPALSTEDTFKVGTSNKYNFVNDVHMTDLLNSGSFIGYRLTGDLIVSSTWNFEDVRLLKFEFLKPKVWINPSDADNDITANFKEHVSALNDIINKPFYVEWISGRINRFYANKDEDTSLVNLKKGIASLFQYQILDGEYVEGDASGVCNVVYSSKSSTQYTKQKFNCHQGGESNDFTRADAALGVTVDPVRITEFTLTPEGDIIKITNNEYFRIINNANKQVGITIDSKMYLNIDGKTETCEIKKGNYVTEILHNDKSLKKQTLNPFFTKTCHGENCLNLVKLVKNLRNLLTDENIGTSNSALALVKMLEVARQTEIDEFVRIFNAHSTKILQSQLFDLLGASQTLNAHEAVNKILDSNSEDDFTYYERYLQALAVGTRPKKAIINDLLSKLKTQLSNKKLMDTMIQTVASMTQRYAVLPGKNYQSDVVEHVHSYIFDSLGSCKDIECKTMFIRGCQNLLAPSSVEILFDYVFNGEKVVSVTAMKALKFFPRNLFNTANIKIKLYQIFYQLQKRFDSSTRTIALDIIFDLQPSYDELKTLIGFLKTNDRAYEVKQYLMQCLRMIAEKCSEFKRNLDTIIKADRYLNNYNIIGLKGLSTALSREYSRRPSFNGSLLSVQEIQGGVLKRGIVDLKIHADDQEFNLFTLGLYAGGLSSFISSKDPDDADLVDDDSATAGMEIAVQGSHLRPLVFFNGQGELMGHVWSGTASEATPAYQATTVLHDHQEIIYLQNGAQVDVSVLGAFSIDLNGQIQLSLWGRNANSRVEENTGMALYGKVSLDTSFISLFSDFTAFHEPHLHLVTNIDFSGDTMLCMKLAQPNYVLSINLLKRERIPKTKYNVKKIRNISYNIPGRTFALNKKNNEMCNMLSK